MIPLGFGIAVMIIFAGIAALWINMGYIWRDVMLNKRNNWIKDYNRLRELELKQ